MWDFGLRLVILWFLLAYSQFSVSGCWTGGWDWLQRCAPSRWLCSDVCVPWSTEGDDYKIVQLLTYAHKSVTLLTTQIKLLHTQAHMSYSLHFGQSRVVVECLVIDDSECACIHESTLLFSQVVPLIVFSHDSRHQKLYIEHWQPSLLLACLTRYFLFFSTVLPIALISSQLNLLSISCSPR